jgi:hypothetical protein
MHVAKHAVCSTGPNKVSFSPSISLSLCFSVALSLSLSHAIFLFL